MGMPLRPNEPGPDWKRERDVFDLYTAFQDIPRIDKLGSDPDTISFPSIFTPQPASDACLTAFAQLAAIRLCAQRSMISLIDGQYQYILAEATPRTPLRVNASSHKEIDIVLGNVRVPRNWGLCEQVLDPIALAAGDPGIIIVKDISQSRQHGHLSCVIGGPHSKFYAGVPIISPKGTAVGAMCIFDGPARTGMVQEDILYLQDLAATVMDYLVTYSLKDQNRRGAEGLHGLLTFAEANTKLKSTHSHHNSAQSGPKVLQSMRVDVDVSIEQEDCVRGASAQTSTGKELPAQTVAGPRLSMRDLQSSIIPDAMRQVFAHAADVLRRSNDMDGVLFLDASVAATSVDRGHQYPSRVSGRPCQVLGFAMHEDYSTSGNASMPENMTPKESDLSWLLKQYPQGYSLDCREEQAITLMDQKAMWTGASCTEDTTTGPSQPWTPPALSTHISTLQALFPNINSALFLPLWCFDRKRWCAGCFCWSTRAERNLSGPRELPFIKAFGHSIMQEVARLDAQDTSQVKTTFLSSLSHELRSPLHGILGSIQLMRSTPLDSFQAAMVNSINVCGRTLLGTVQHLLDHAGRKDSSHSCSLKTFPQEHTVCITADAPAADMTRNSGTAKTYCNLGLITEEVVETMFLGQARYDVSLGGEETPGRPVDQASGSAIARRRIRFVIEDIADYQNLDFLISSSSYGRIVMNLLGNSLKFTESGHILLSVRSGQAEGSKVLVTLRISDSGIGISRDFLLNDLFEPFRKQNQHSAGTGVGLSVVKHIVEDIGGSIVISSEVDKGTDITVNLSLERYKRPEEPDSPHITIAAALSRLKNRKISLLHSKSPDANGPPEHLRDWQTLQRYVSALVKTLEVELKMEVTLISEWNGQDESDIVICPEVSFESLQKIRDTTHRKPPPALFIAMDTMEADTLRYDARVTSSASVVEVVTQPCGPYKLGMVLSQCLSRYDKTDNVVSDDMGPTLEHHLTANVNGSQLVSELGPRLGLYASLPYSSQSEESQTRIPAASERPLSPPEPVSKLEKLDVPEDLPVLIVDDNAINRQLLGAFMKKRKFAYQEAKDGLQALKKYKEAEGKFRVILMDISMPVMDGITSARLIREHENTTKLTCTHIIALTGLTSASAKLEAWTSGVDDFLTKPVDFENLQSLMKVGRGGEGTGFLSDQGRREVEEKGHIGTARDMLE